MWGIFLHLLLLNGGVDRGEKTDDFGGAGHEAFTSQGCCDPLVSHGRISDILGRRCENDVRGTFPVPGPVVATMGNTLKSFPARKIIGAPYFCVFHVVLQNRAK